MLDAKLKASKKRQPAQHDLFAMALPPLQFKYVPVPEPQKSAPEAQEEPEPTVTYRSVTSYEGGASLAKLHPVDRHRALSKSLSDIKKQKLDKRKAKATAQGVGDFGLGARARRS